MTSKILSLIRSNAEFDIVGTLPLVLEQQASLERTLVFCRNLRKRGICSLFLEGLPQPLHANLQKSGAAYLNGLRYVADSDKVTSKAAPFFDAVACGDFATAQQISRYSRTTWNKDEEYEDDFLYTFVLMAQFFLGYRDERLHSMLNHYRELLGKNHDPRFDICASFMQHDNALFERALCELILIHEDTYRVALERDEILEEDWATEGRLFVEGLALVRLAQQTGLLVEKNYQFIPSLVIATQSTSGDPDSWKSL